MEAKNACLQMKFHIQLKSVVERSILTNLPRLAYRLVLKRCEESEIEVPPSWSWIRMIQGWVAVYGCLFVDINDKVGFLEKFSSFLGFVKQFCFSIDSFFRIFFKKKTLWTKLIKENLATAKKSISSDFNVSICLLVVVNFFHDFETFSP